jgi:ERCC4-type nuclease
VAYADSLDLVGKNSRQRKPRIIRMDTRERDAVTANLLTGMGYTLEHIGMPVGDYGWDLREGSWLQLAGNAVLTLERKTLADLRDTGRLKKQLDRMSWRRRFSPVPREFFIVMIEHAFDTDRKRRWPEESILNAELSIQLGGVHVTRCEGNDVAGRLDSLYKWSQKRTHQLAGGE